ncbi:hypothetical protein [Rhodococcus pyridinivorans]
MPDDMLMRPDDVPTPVPTSPDSVAPSVPALSVETLAQVAGTAAR